MPSSKQLDNLQFVCADHAPKPESKYASEPLSFFKGKWVKKAFRVNYKKKDWPQREHIWVKILGDKDGVLYGTLANQPLFLAKKNYGDEVTVALDEIEDLSLTAD
jgi:uncharacterized protein YegJ (DUF2314 family)